jgi:hypothetical protein
MIKMALELKQHSIALHHTPPTWQYVLPNSKGHRHELRWIKEGTHNLPVAEVPLCGLPNLQGMFPAPNASLGSK